MIKHKTHELVKQLDDAQTLTSKEVSESLSVDQVKGLTNDQAEANQKRYGENKILERKKRNVFVKFLFQFKDPLILILLVAAIISFIFLAFTTNITVADIAEPCIILLIVIVNAFIGVIQEQKADKAVEALKKLTTSKARVIRNGEIVTIPTDEITIGDILYFEAGDNIYADARIITCNNIKCVESSLTGESLPVEKFVDPIWTKKTPLGDRNNMLFSGCSIVAGSGTAIVVNIGMQTQLGKIATMLKEVKPERTPLQKQIARFSKWISVICICICVIALGLEVGGVFIQQLNTKDAHTWLNAVMVAVSLAVAAVPEGLPIVITVTMSIGVTRMAKQQAIVKDLLSVEVLGSASVICSDKTGTLTQNKMTLTDVYDFKTKQIFDLKKKINENVKQIIEYATLCTNASFASNSKQGDPTELCIVHAYNNVVKGNDKLLDKKCPRARELPFDSNRKLMSTINKINGKYYVITKGAVDQLIKVCSLSVKDKALIEKTNNELATLGKRTLAVAIKEISSKQFKAKQKDIESKLNFIGLLTMIDPPRKEVKKSIEECHAAGIKVVMITGDHILTAKSIAEELEIWQEGDKAITGAELDKMSDRQFLKEIKHISVYARVSPENKVRIARMWKRAKAVIAMIGDGVNDAPALQEANIGCAMGTSTDVSKDASDMILQDDNFKTVVNAVSQGRSIFANIIKVINFLIATNLAEIICFTGLIVAGLCFTDWHQLQVVTLSSLQILWINLIGDSLPAIALAMEPGSKSVMLDKPRDTLKSVFADGIWFKIIYESIFMGLASLGSFFLCYFVTKNTGEGDASFWVRAGSTGAFLTLSLMQMVQIFHLKTNNSIFKTKLFNNWFLLLSVAISLLLILTVALIPPVAKVFNMTTFYEGGNISLQYLWLAIIILGCPLLFMEIEKPIYHNVFHSKMLVKNQKLQVKVK